MRCLKIPLRLASTPLMMVALSLLILSGCSETEETENAAPKLIKAVKTQVIEYQTGNLERVLSGTTISSDEQGLSFRVPGVITKLPIQVGDILNKGDLIAQLDTTNFDIAIKQAQANVAQANASHVGAQSAYQRAKELYTAQAASLADLESAKANADSAKAYLHVAQQQLNSALKNQQYTRLSSSSDACQVTDIKTAINSNIVASSPIVGLSCGNFMRAKITVPEVLIDQVNVGKEVNITIPSARPEPFLGAVVEVGVSNNNSAGFDVEVEIKEVNKNLRVGLAASVTLQITKNNLDLNAQNVTMLSPQAVLQDTNGKFVYALEPTNTATVFTANRKSVITGKLLNEGVEVISGLSEGDEIIVSGASRVNQGMQVKRLTAQ